MNEFPYAKYDLDYIKDNVTIEDALGTYMGESPKRNGLVHCPAPDHTDKNPSASISKDHKSCHCFSCNSSFDVIDLAKINYGSETSFSDLCHKVVDDFGLDIYRCSDLAEREAAKNAPKTKKPEFKEFFPLKSEELREIGLKGYGGGTYDVSDMYGQEFEPYDGQGHAIKCPSLQQLWEEDKESVEEMLLAHIGEQLSSYQTLQCEVEEKAHGIYLDYQEGRKPVSLEDAIALYRDVCDRKEAFEKENPDKQFMIPRSEHAIASDMRQFGNLTLLSKACGDYVQHFQRMADKITSQAEAREQFKEKQEKQKAHKKQWGKDRD